MKYFNFLHRMQYVASSLGIFSITVVCWTPFMIINTFATFSSKSAFFNTLKNNLKKKSDQNLNPYYEINVINIFNPICSFFLHPCRLLLYLNLRQQDDLLSRMAVKADIMHFEFFYKLNHQFFLAY